MTAAHVVAALVNSTWQSALVVLTAMFALHLAKRTSAAARCAVWYAVLVIAAILPFVDLAASLAPHARPQESYRISFAPVTARASSREASWKGKIVAVPRAPANDSLERAAVALGASAPWLERAWLAIVVLLGLRLAYDTIRLLAAKRVVRPLRRDIAMPPGSRPYRIGTSRQVETPCVLGLYDPVVALPESLANALSDDDLARVVSHEAAHVQRHDDWIHLGERALRALLFFNPLLYAIGRRLAVEREIACDDRAVASCGNRIAYATCLSSLASYLATARAADVPALFAGRRQLLVRVERLLDGAHDGSSRFGARAVAAFACVVAVAFVVPHFGIPVRAQMEKIASVVHLRLPRAILRKPVHRISVRVPLRPVALAPRAVASRPIARPRPRPSARIAPAPRARRVAPRPAARAIQAAAPAAPAAAAAPDDGKMMTMVSFASARAEAEADARAESSASAAVDGMRAVAVGDDYARAVVAFTHDARPGHIAYLRKNGITPAYLASLAKVGITTHCAVQYVRLFKSGVTSSVVTRLQLRFGTRRLEVDRIIRMARAGV